MEEKYPWISFKVDVSKLSFLTWIKLGECVSKSVHICRVPLKPNVAEEMHKIYLAKGAQATTAIEGNTLTEEEVRLRMEHQLKLPPSKEYLGQEVDNIIRLCNEIMEKCGRPRERGHVWPRWFFQKHDDARGEPFYGKTIPKDSFSIAHTLNYFLVR